MQLQTLYVLSSLVLQLFQKVNKLNHGKVKQGHTAENQNANTPLFPTHSDLC